MTNNNSYLQTIGQLWCICSYNENSNDVTVALEDGHGESQEFTILQNGNINYIFRDDGEEKINQLVNEKSMLSVIKDELKNGDKNKIKEFLNFIKNSKKTYKSSVITHNIFLC